MTRCSAKAEGGVRLFGVRLTDGSFIKKSASMGNLISNCSVTAAGALESPEGYHSDDPAIGSAANAAFHRAHRKRGTPWTEEEHRKFLRGLQNLGKGDWRGISKNYVPSRTPTQVASHAQKYFIRQTNTTRRKKRSSLFDMTLGMKANSSPMPEQFSIQPQTINIVSSPRETGCIDGSLPSLALTLKPAFMPLPFQLWPPNATSDNEDDTKMPPPILTPTPVVQEEPVKEMVGLSELNLGRTELNLGRTQLTFPSEPSSFSLRLLKDL